MIVRCQETKHRLAKEVMLGAGNSYRTIDASAMAVFLADLEVHKRINRIVSLERDAAMRDPNYMAILPVAASFLTGEGHAATFLKQMATDMLSPVQPMPSIEPVEAWSYKNAALVAQTYTLAATSHGLATCMMEGFDTRRAKEILRVPDRYGVPLMVATGYEYEGGDGWSGETKRTPRLEMEEVFFGDTFGESLDLDESEQQSNDIKEEVS
uniref:Nitroreductase domain-containing protein n=2 Tax=Ditylum brightwellii TaxID=49249 RepID=A0A7S4SZV1_9STRA